MQRDSLGGGGRREEARPRCGQEREEREEREERVGVGGGGCRRKLAGEEPGEWGGERAETKRTPSLSYGQLQPQGTAKKISLRGSEGLHLSGSTPIKDRSGGWGAHSGRKQPWALSCAQGCRDPENAQWSRQGQAGDPPHRHVQPLTGLDTPAAGRA